MKLLPFLLLALAPSALAEPFLLADPYPPSARQPDEFALFFDGAHQPVVVPAQTGPDGARLQYDLAGLPKGKHTVMAKARAAGTESGASAPFAFDLSDLAPPGGFSLVFRVTVEVVR